MITVKQAIEALSKYPAEALCYAYEGEITGIVVVTPGEKRELGVIEASEQIIEPSERIRL